MISLIVFLGNPGKSYNKTRHNVGWMTADYWAPAKNADWKEKYKGLYAKIRPVNRNIHLLKPLTFMNRSGDSAVRLTEYLHIDPEEILVVHDHLERPFGYVGVKEGGGLGGHNGLKSMANHLGRDFARLEIGISRPSRGDVSSYVLSRFSPEEEAALSTVLEEASRLLTVLVD
jgi:PTH1 family peptidyl-tRNA hydrolase